MAYVWDKHISLLRNRKLTIVDSLFTSVISDKYISFKLHPQPDTFVWHPLLIAYVCSYVDQRQIKLKWIKNVDTVYMPMNWGKRHWVALVVDLNKGHIDILDPFEDFTSARKVVSFMSPLAEMLPKLIAYVCFPVASSWPSDGFTFTRVPRLSQNTRGGDCGPLYIKFIEFHLHGLPEALEKITPTQIDNLRMCYAINIYEKFVSKL